MSKLTGVNKVILNWFGGPADRKGEGVDLATKVPGADASNVVASIGEGVTRWKAGDAVFGLWHPWNGNGTNQAYLTLPVDATLVPKPTNLSHVEAASLPLVFLTSYTSLVMRRGLDRDPEVNARQGAKVLIVRASGGTGIIGVQMAKALGANVVAICSGKNADFVKGYEADEVCIAFTFRSPWLFMTAPTSVSDPRLYNPRHPLRTLQRPVQSDLCCVGGTQLIPHLTALLGPAPNPNEPHHSSSPGTYITIVGDKTSRTVMGGNTTYFTTPSMLFRSTKSHLGVGPKCYCVSLTTGEEEMRALAEWSAGGRVRPVIDGEPWRWTKVGEAYGQLESGRARGKVVVDWTKE